MTSNTLKKSEFPHEQHQKHLKHSSILQLETETGILEGHSACSSYLEGEVAKLLLNPAILDPASQEILLAEVEPVFTEEDNKMLLAYAGTPWAPPYMR